MSKFIEVRIVTKRVINITMLTTDPNRTKKNIGLNKLTLVREGCQDLLSIEC